MSSGKSVDQANSNKDAISTAGTMRQGERGHSVKVAAANGKEKSTTARLVS